MSDRTEPVVPAPEPRWNQARGPQWGQTPQPVQEPVDEPRGARTGMLLLLAAVVVAALVLLSVALARS
jgi:hypothetical protein